MGLGHTLHDELSINNPCSSVKVSLYLLPLIEADSMTLSEREIVA